MILRLKCRREMEKARPFQNTPSGEYDTSKAVKGAQNIVECHRISGE